MPTVMITGSNRGLGLEFVRQYLDTGWDVIASCRKPGSATVLRQLQEQHERLQVEALDVGDFDAVDALAARLRNRAIDLLINNAGVFGPKRGSDGDYRQSFGQIDYEIMTGVLRINALAPLKVAEAFLDHVAASGQKKIVTISSGLGSIGGTDTGLYAYRASKAAVNMLMATLANELRDKGVIVTVFNPGWVKTDMGGADASLGVEDSISRLRGRIAALTGADSGAFLNYDGDRLPW